MWETITPRSARGMGNKDKRMAGTRTPEGREGKASYKRSNRLDKKGGDLNLAKGEPFSTSF